jgi:hypothetical protein
MGIGVIVDIGVDVDEGISICVAVGKGIGVNVGGRVASGVLVTMSGVRVGELDVFAPHPVTSNVTTTI